MEVVGMEGLKMKERTKVVAITANAIASAHSLPIDFHDLIHLSGNSKISDLFINPR